MLRKVFPIPMVAATLAQCPRLWQFVGAGISACCQLELYNWAISRGHAPSNEHLVVQSGKTNLNLRSHVSSNDEQ